MLLRYEYFVRITLFFTVAYRVAMESMKFQKPKSIYFEDNIFFLHLRGPIEQVYTHNEMSYVLNLGLITPLHTIVYP